MLYTSLTRHSWSWATISFHLNESSIEHPQLKSSTPYSVYHNKTDLFLLTVYITTDGYP